MKNILHKLHEKPEHHKNSVAFAVSFFVTLVIFGIWASALSTKFSDISSVAKETEKQLEDGITPLATVKDSFDEASQGLKDLKAQFAQ
jgi:hypothetical protein